MHFKKVVLVANVAILALLALILLLPSCQESAHGAGSKVILTDGVESPVLPFAWQSLPNGQGEVEQSTSGAGRAVLSCRPAGVSSRRCVAESN